MKTGDFVTLNYTGKLADGTIFDTTKPEHAQAAGATGGHLHPATICLGEGMLLPGLEKAILGKKPSTFTVDLTSEDAFGKKDPKLLRIIPTEQLKKQGINPQPGMQLNIDNSYGTVKSSGGGRTVVDFNHPLASQDVSYDIELIGTVEDPAEQIAALLHPLGVHPKVTVDGKNATVTLPALPPKPIMDMLQDKITKLTTVTTVSFEAGKK